MGNRQTRIAWLALAALVVAAAIAYLPVRGNAFIDIDDPIYITTNPHVSEGLGLSGIRWAFTTFFAANWHPLTWLSHMLDCQLWGLRPAWHHATNVLLHIANACLVFAMLRLMTGSTWRSFFVAALLALHPVHVESVAWAAERKDLLAAFFGLLSICFYIRYARGQGRIGWYWLTFLALALGLLSKPTVVTLPLVFLLVDYWPLQRWFVFDTSRAARRRAKSRTIRKVHWRIFYEKIPFLLLSLGSCVATFLAQKRGGAVASVEQWPIEQRLANAAVSYLRYLGAIFWPRGLAVFYPLSATGWPKWLVLFSVLVLLVVTTIAFVLRGRRPYLLIGLLWFLGMLVPAIGIVQVGGQAIADRYLYLPSIGLTIAVVWYVADQCKDAIAARLCTGAAVAVLIACAGLTYRQVRFWKDTESLMRRTLAVVPDNAFCRFYLGSVAASEARADEAISEFSRAITLQSNYTPPYVGLGRILMVLGRFDEAREKFSQAARLKPYDSWIYWNYGDLSALQGDWKSAAKAYRRSLELHPDEPTVMQNLALSLIQIGDFQHAQDTLQELLRLYPNDLARHYQLAMVLFRNGQAEQAERELSQIADNPAPMLTPQVAMQIHWNLAMLALRSGKIDRAIPRLREAARLNPNLAPALQNLAWILATHPDPQKRDPAEAVRLAERANDLSGRQIPEIIDTLAAAYAANRQFTRAAEVVQEAKSLAERAGKPALAAQIEGRLKLYRAGKTFIDESLAPRP